MSLEGNSRCQGTWHVNGGAGEESPCWREEGDEIGSWRKREVATQRRVPEQILYLLVFKAVWDLCLESQSSSLILLDWSLQCACW